MRFKKKKKFILLGGLIILILILITGGLFCLANTSLSNSIKKVEKDRDDSIVILKQSIDIQNQGLSKMAQLFGNNNPNYKDSDALYNDIQNLVNKASKLDQDFVANGQKQKDDFRPMFSFMLSINKKSQITEIRKSLDVEYKNCLVSKDNNTNEMYAIMPLIRSTVDMVAVGEAIGASNISEALVKATPLQRYTRQGFSFENESLVKTTNPGAYDAIQNSKKLFADTYNYLLAENSRNYQEADNLWNGLSNRFEVTAASIANAANDKNPLSETFYQTEIAGIEQYLGAMDKLGVSFNKERETAYYTFHSISYYNEREKKYPRVSDFNVLKQILNLKYGSSDYLKYSSSSDTSFTLDYLNNGEWVKIEIKDSGSSNTPSSQA